MEYRLTRGPPWWDWNKHLKQPAQPRIQMVSSALHLSQMMVWNSLGPIKASGLFATCLVSHS